MFRKVSDGGAARPLVTVTLDGAPVIVEQGEPVAAILLRHAPLFSRTTPVSGERRAPFCMMGACFECLVQIDGETSIRSCLVRARDGMMIARQIGRPATLRHASV